jgi:hypothetical protein
MAIPATSKPQPAVLARLGLLGVYTLMVRRSSRPAIDPSLPGEVGLAFRSERFGFRTRIPDGSKVTTEESLRIQGYGELALLDVEIAAAGGSRACILAAIEPAPPAPGAIDLAARVFAMSGNGERTLCEEGAGPGESREVTVTSADGAIEASRIFVVGSRVLCASAYFAPRDERAHRDLRTFLRSFDVGCFEVDADGAPKKKPSGTYVAIGRSGGSSGNDER